MSFFSDVNAKLLQCTDMRFASFLSGGFTTMAVMNPPEKKLEKCTSVQYVGMPVQQKCLNIDLLLSQSSLYYQLVCYFLIG